jgi:hypothetical protein
MDDLPNPANNVSDRPFTVTRSQINPEVDIANGMLCDPASNLTLDNRPSVAPLMSNASTVTIDGSARVSSTTLPVQRESDFARGGVLIAVVPTDQDPWASEIAPVPANWSETFTSARPFPKRSVTLPDTVAELGRLPKAKTARGKMNRFIGETFDQYAECERGAMQVVATPRLGIVASFLQSRPDPS